MFQPERLCTSDSRKLSLSLFALSTGSHKLLAVKNSLGCVASVIFQAVTHGW